VPKQRHYLQLLDKSGNWCDLMPIDVGGKKVSRGGRTVMRLGYEDSQLVVQDTGSLNGLYLRITQPVELVDNLRFRIGNQIIEFRAADRFEPVEPMSSDGEEFLSRDLEPLAYLDLIRPNGRTGISFPLTMPDQTVIGREKKSEVNIALTGDALVSGRHAGVAMRDGKFFLEDLKSTNGTYVKIQDSAPVKSGDEILAGQVLFRIIDEARR
jgi:pSer/pThr/pTyr-binding forkhead associated (FHA) protein